MKKVTQSNLLDMNIYIANFRNNAYANLVKSPSNFLSAIVLTELYIGATQSQKRVIRRKLEKHYVKKVEL